MTTVNLGELRIGISLDQRELDRQIRLLEGREVNLGLAFDTRALQNFTRQLQEVEKQRLSLERAFSQPLAIRVDDTALTNLNKHFRIKEEDHKKLQQHFNRNPLTPRVNLKELDQLEQRLNSVGNKNPEIKIGLDKAIADKELDKLSKTSLKLEGKVNLEPIKELQIKPLVDGTTLRRQLDAAVGRPLRINTVVGGTGRAASRQQSNLGSVFNTFLAGGRGQGNLLETLANSRLAFGGLGNVATSAKGGEAKVNKGLATIDQAVTRLTSIFNKTDLTSLAKLKGINVDGLDKSGIARELLKLPEVYEELRDLIEQKILGIINDFSDISSLRFAASKLALGLSAADLKTLARDLNIQPGNLRKADLAQLIANTATPQQIQRAVSVRGLGGQAVTPSTTAGSIRVDRANLVEEQVQNIETALTKGFNLDGLLSKLEDFKASILNNLSSIDLNSPDSSQLVRTYQDLLERINRIQQAHSRTTDSMEADWLEAARQAAIAGKKIQGGMSEASPGPTYRIRRYYNQTIKSISEGFQRLVKASQQTGRDIERPIVNSFKNIVDVFKEINFNDLDIDSFTQALEAGQSFEESLGAAFDNLPEQIQEAIRSLNELDNNALASLTKYFQENKGLDLNDYINSRTQALVDLNLPTGIEQRINEFLGPLMGTPLAGAASMLSDIVDLIGSLGELPVGSTFLQDFISDIQVLTIKGEEFVSGFINYLNDPQLGRDLLTFFNGLQSRLATVLPAIAKFGSLFLVGKLAITAVTTTISSLVNGIKDLLFNVQRNIQAFEKLYSLRLRFKSAGLDPNQGFNTAQQFGVSLDAVKSQAGLVQSLSTNLGQDEAQRVANNLFSGLDKRGLFGEELIGSLQALEQIANKNVVSMEELRQQLGERLPNTFQIAADAMGVTTDQLTALVSSGELAAYEFLPAFAKELNNVGTAAEKPQAELQRTINIIEKFRAVIGEAVLKVTKPFLQLFNALANNEIVITGLIGVLTGLSAVILALAAAGLKAILSIGAVQTVLKGLTTSAITASRSILTLNLSFGALATGAKGLVVSLGALTKLLAPLILLGTLLAAATVSLQAAFLAGTYQSSALKTLKEMTTSAKELADSLDKVNDKAKEVGDRFKDDLLARFVNAISFGGLERKAENQEKINVSDLLTQGDRIFSKGVKNAEGYKQLIEEIQSKQSRLAGKEVELIRLKNAKAAPREIQAIQREISALTIEIAESQKELTSFISYLDRLEQFTQTKEFSLLPEDSRKAITDQIADFKKFLPFVQAVLKELKQKTLFELNFDIAQASLEGIKQKLEKSLAEIDLSALQQALTTSTTVGLNIDTSKLKVLQSELEAINQTIAKQQETLLKDIDFGTRQQLEKLLGTDLLSAPIEKIKSVLVELEQSGDSNDSILAKALQKALQLKELELEAVNARKEVLLLEQQIQAKQLARAISAKQLSALQPLGAVNRSSIQAQIDLAGRQISEGLGSTAVSIANARIELDKAVSTLSITNNNLSAVTSGLNSLPAAIQQWLLNELKRSNLSDLINTVSSEELQQVRNSKSDEIGSSPVREQAFSLLEQAIALRDSSDQLRLQVAQGQTELTNQFRELRIRFRDFSESLQQQIQDTEAEIKRIELDNFFKRLNNQLRGLTLGETESIFARFNNVLLNLVGQIQGIAGQELSLEDEQRQQARILRDLTRQLAELNREASALQNDLSTLANSSDSLTAKFDKLGSSIDDVINKGLGKLKTPANNIVPFSTGGQQSTGGNGIGSNQPDLVNDLRSALNLQLAAKEEEAKIIKSNIEALAKEREAFVNPKATLEQLARGQYYDPSRFEGEIPGITPPGFADKVQQRFDTLYQIGVQNEKDRQRIISEARDIKEQLTSDVDRYGSAIVPGSEGFNPPQSANVFVPKAPQLQELQSAFDTKNQLTREGIKLDTESISIEATNAFSSLLRELEDDLLNLKRSLRSLSEGTIDLAAEFGIFGNGVTYVGREVELAQRQIQQQREAINDQITQVARQLGFDRDKVASGQINQSDIEASLRKVGIEPVISALKSQGFDTSAIQSILQQNGEDFKAIASEFLNLLSGLPEALNNLEGLAPAIEGVARTRAEREIKGVKAGLDSSYESAQIDNAVSGGFLGFNTERQLKLRQEELRIAEELVSRERELQDLLDQKKISQEEFNQYLEQANIIADQQRELAKDQQSLWYELASSISTNLQEAFTSFFSAQKSLWESLRDFALGVLNAIAAKAAQVLAQQIVAGIFGSALGGGGTASKLMGAGAGVKAFAYGSAKPKLFNNLGDAWRYERRTSGNQPRLAVLNEGEAVLSANTGDAQLYQKLLREGTWQQLKVNQTPSYNQIPSYALGTPVSVGNNAYRSVSSQQTPGVNIYVTTPDANSFRSSDSQIASRTAEALRRAQRRNS